MRPTETVIILVNYNNTQDTVTCVESINEIDGELPFIIVVDNCSENIRLLIKLEQEISNLKLIENKSNLGFGRANNVGISWAFQHLEFSYLLLLNNDTIIDKDAITAMKMSFDLDPLNGIVTAKILYLNDKNKVWYGGGTINKFRGRPQIIDFNQTATNEGANKAKEVSFISGCSMMFSRDSIEKLQGFDDDFFMYCEDLELCMRAIRVGYKLYYQPEAIVYHKVQGSIKKDSNNVSGLRATNPNLKFLFFHMKSNQYLAMTKHLKGIALICFKFFFWIEYFYICTRLLIGGRKDIFSISKETIRRINKFKKV